MSRALTGPAQETLEFIRHMEEKGRRLIGDDVTGFRFVATSPWPVPFFGPRHHITDLVEAGLVEEYMTGCYRVTEAGHALLFSGEEPTDEEETDE